MAFPKLREQLRQKFRRVLQIAVHHGYGLAPRVVDARVEGRLVAEIAAQNKDAHGRKNPRPRLF
ncbi:MAG: hypothetical protein BWY66_01864 [bacterium ADurb.Bin374]|nr:MAG: hypothetical protein BWY66_01864 [bacterium ADurb.Bin374]